MKAMLSKKRQNLKNKQILPDKFLVQPIYIFKMDYEIPRFIVRKMENGRLGYGVAPASYGSSRFTQNFIFSCYYKQKNGKFVIIEENKVHQRHGKVLDDVTTKGRAMHECYNRAMHFATERVNKRRAMGQEVELGEEH
jgi:hypothetical protein